MKRRSTTGRRAIPLLVVVPLLLSATASCMKVVKRTEFNDTYLRTDAVDAGREAVRTADVVYDVPSDYSRGSVAIRPTERTDCLTSRRNVYSRRERTTREYTGFMNSQLSDETGKLFVGGGFAIGVGGMAFGAVQLARAPNLSTEEPVDPETGEKEVSEREVAMNQGALGLALGTPLMLWGAVESLRSLNTSRWIGEVSGAADVERRECGRRPLAGKVTLDLPGHRLDLGATSGEPGEVRVDLAQLLVPAIPASLPMQLDGQEIAPLELSAELRGFILQAATIADSGKADLRRFLEQFPTSFVSEAAKTRLTVLLDAEAAAFVAALREPTVGGLRAVLLQHPSAEPEHSERATAKLHELEFATAASAGTPEAMVAYFAEYPTALQASDARKRATDGYVTRGRKAVRDGDYAAGLVAFQNARTLAGTEAHEIDSEIASVRDRIPLSAVKTAEAACELFAASALDTTSVLAASSRGATSLEGRYVDIGGVKVIQVLRDGFLGQIEGEERTFYFAFANPNFGTRGLVDEAFVQVLGRVRGTYQYVSVLGAPKTVQRIDLIWIYEGRNAARGVCR